MLQALLLTALSVYKFSEPYQNGDTSPSISPSRETHSLDHLDYMLLITCCLAQLFYFVVAWSLSKVPWTVVINRLLIVVGVHMEALQKSWCRQDVQIYL